MGKKRAPKKKAAGMKDLPTKSRESVTGGRTTTHTDFGTIVKGGITKT